MAIKKLFVFFLFFITINSYGSDKINKINFEGLHRISSNLVLSKIPIKIGDKINNNKIKKIINSLYSTHNFEDIKVFQNGKKLTIRVKELPIISRITFMGNKIIKNEEIEKVLEDHGVFVGNILNPSVISSINKGLESFYPNIGNYNTVIKSIVTPLPNNYVDIKFIFNEGVCTNIYQINIVGNNKFTSDKLISLFKLRDKRSWWNITKINRYQKEILESDLKNLRNFYLENGYLRFKVKSTKLSLTPDKKGIYITIYIDEGDQYRVSGISLKGNLDGHTQEAHDLITISISVDDLYSINDIKEVKNNIKKLIMNFGYSFPVVTVHYKIDDVNKKVRLDFNANVGNRYYVRNIDFEGNNVSKDIVLRRTIKQMEGTWLSGNLIDQSTELLKRTGFFKTVELEKKFLPNHPDQVDLIYKVKESNTGSIKFGLGYGITNNLNFQFSINKDNLFGTGSSISLNALKNKKQTEAEVLLIDPYLTINGISLSNRFFYSKLFKDNSSNEYSNENYGFDSTIGFPFNENNRLNLGVGYINSKILNVGPQIAAYRYFKSVKDFECFPSYRGVVVGDINFNYGWNYNTLDRNFFPSEGNYINLKNKITFVGSTNKFLKFSLDGTKYIPIDKEKNWILLGHSHLGYGYGLGKDHEMPFYENFYLGGPKTLRGFGINSIGPKAVYLKQDTVTSDCIKKGTCILSDTPVGGNATISSNLELIFPTPFINEKYVSSFRTSLFFDVGNVWDTKWETTYDGKLIENLPNYNSPEKIRMSTGITLQWLSPIGPIELSYAIPIKKYDGDQIENFQLFIGKTW
ncbi:outer membrane protein assembly factor BamA [Candidatus Pantoea edessiphila]|uniref:Outer membrane protein assembly factor BamA n=1 Tax=Candidatus Pantoea edessiphila TaxID=2044610 RepID=A0A2P5T2A3_9GAMM|nr:outer membrane protein assembly factor BamA [Candidatus Pantoea edessiphila]PPI88680.1 outer membrane protein assembly factor BamA [Candidatus Pantoea edessiphila]